MANIPTVPGSEIVQTRPAGVKADFGALDAPNQARLGLAGTIGQAGEVLGNVSQKMQEVANYSILSDADRQMRKATADFHASLAGRTDETNWEKDWLDKADEVRQGIYDQHGAGPALQRQLDTHFKDWTQANGIEVRSLARKQTINRAVERANLAADEAAKDGDEPGVKAALEPLISLGAAYPEQVQGMVLKHLDRIDHYAATNFITADPIHAEESLQEKDAKGNYVNFPRLTPEARLTLGFQAHRMAVEVRSDTAADFFNRKQAFYAGDGPDVPPDEVRQAVVQGRLTPAQAKQFLKPPKADFSPGKFATLYNDIAAYDPAKDIDKSGYAALMARAAYDPEIKGPAASDAIEMLKHKNDPKNVTNSPLAQQGNKIIAENFSRGIYGQINKLVMGADGQFKLKTDPKGLEQAQVMRAQVQTALDAWLAKPENKNVTAADVQQFIHNFHRSARINSLWAPAVNPQTGRLPEGAWVEPDRED